MSQNLHEKGSYCKHSSLCSIVWPLEGTLVRERFFGKEMFNGMPLQKIKVTMHCDCLKRCRDTCKARIYGWSEGKLM